MRPNRKTNPAVKGGRVQKKNWDGTTHNYYDHDEPELVIERQRPGPGARHLLSNEDIRRFIRLIPNWAEASQGLRAIVLVPYDERTLGRYNVAGIIKVCAWRRELWVEMGEEQYGREKLLLDLFHVDVELIAWGYLAKYTEAQAKGAQLLGTFLHELGHHVDRISGRNQWDCHNGEPFADGYEAEWGAKLFPAYVREFGL